MRDDQRNAVPKQEPEEQRQTLKFFFTPVDPPKAGMANPNTQRSTYVPEVVEALRARFGEAVLDVEAYAGEQTVRIALDRIVEACRFLKQEHGFTYLCDLGGIDRFTDEDRFEVFYNLVNIDAGKRLRLKVRVGEENPVVPSVTPVYRAANWNEREAFDMLGLRFEGHPDLRRMYMPEDFEYFPLRKEFPQLGIPGSLPLPPQVPEGPLTMDPFAAAHGHPAPKSFAEPKSDLALGEDDA
jgi:NADH-quinone oxidoreductase subunit C